MAFHTFLTCKRLVSGSMTTVYQHVPAQVDESNYDEVGYQPDGSSPADAFMIYVKFGAGYTFQRGDELTDELNGGNVYNVLSRPAKYPNGHVELKTYSVVGS